MKSILFMVVLLFSCPLICTSISFSSMFLPLIPGYSLVGLKPHTPSFTSNTALALHNGRRSLLQVTTDSVSFSIVIAASETNTTQAAIFKANATVEGFTSSAPPVFVPASCPANSISPEGSISVTQCSCLPGYEGNASNGSSCVPCPIDTFCASGKLGLCPANSHAPAVSDSILDCSCYPGFYGNGSVSCTRCPSNSFCTGGFALEACTLNAISPAQSTSTMACYCDRGLYGINNTRCKLCESGSWCWTGIKNQCPSNSSSPSGSSRLSSCVCLDGFENVPLIDNSNQSTSVCTACRKDTYCKVLCCPIPVYNTPFHTPLHACFHPCIWRAAIVLLFTQSHSHGCLSGWPNLA